MRDKIIIVLGIVVLVLAGTTGLFYKQMRQNKKDAVRHENNFLAVQDELSSVKVTKDEFIDNLSEENDSLLNELKIKPKQVDRIVQVTNEVVITDTIEIPVYETSDPERFYFIDNIDCIQVEGSITVNDGLPSLEITKLQSRIESTYVVYQKRKGKTILGIHFKKLGRKRTELEVTSSCGKTEVHEIEIIKE